MKSRLIKIIGFGIIAIILLIALPCTPVFAGNPPDATNSTFSVTPASAPADGVTKLSITVTLLDSGSAPVVGDDVFIAVPTDSTASIATVSGTTDINGEATFTVASTTPGTASVDITDTTAVVTITGMGHITFNTVPTPTNTPTPTPTSVPASTSSNSTSSNTCSSTYPTDAPNLYQVTMASGSAYIYFVEPLSQFDGYTISYGLNSNADMYNVTFSGRRVGAATEFTINDLTLNKQYYFKVRANNGCAPGIWSGVRSGSISGGTLVSSGGTLLSAGPGNIIMVIGFVGLSIFTAGLMLVAVI